MVVEWNPLWRRNAPVSGRNSRYAITASLRYLWVAAGADASIERNDGVLDREQSEKFADIDQGEEPLWDAWTEKLH